MRVNVLPNLIEPEIRGYVAMKKLLGLVLGLTMLTFMPSVGIYKKFFGSYNAACKVVNCEPLYNKNIPKNFFEKLPLRRYFSVSLIKWPYPIVAKPKESKYAVFLNPSFVLILFFKIRYLLKLS